MSKICINCGNKINLLQGDPISLIDNQVLCNQCAKPIKSDMNNLYYAATKEEYEELKNKIISKSKSHFNENITKYIVGTVLNLGSKLGWEDTNQQKINADIHSSNVNSPMTHQSATSNNIETTSGMFSNIGSKIKTLAQVMTWLGIIAFIIIGIGIMALDDEMIFIGLIVMVVGGILSWVSSFVLYGFGQLVENSDKMVQLLKK